MHPARTAAEHLAAGLEWLRGKTQTERDNVTQRTGCRWCEFCRLEYFDGVKIHPIEPMVRQFVGALWSEPASHVRFLMAALSALHVHGRL